MEIYENYLFSIKEGKKVAKREGGNYNPKKDIKGGQYG